MTMSETASESGTGWGGLLGTTALVLLVSSQPTHIVRFWCCDSPRALDDTAPHAQASSPVPSTSSSVNRAPLCFLRMCSSRSSYCRLHLAHSPPPDRLPLFNPAMVECLR